MTRRPVGVLCVALLLVSSALVTPSQARRFDSRLDRLERRVESLRVMVVELENALGLPVQPRTSGPPERLFVGERSKMSDADRSRVRRLQRRLVHLDDRISALEAAKAASSGTTVQGRQPATLARLRPLAQRALGKQPLGQLSRWLTQLERRARQVKSGPSPSPSPTGSLTPSPSASPSASQSPSTTQSPSASPPPSSSIAPSPSPSSSAAACYGVRVTPGVNLQAVVDANPPRTTFCFAAGVYRLSGTIWTGDKYPTFDLRAGAIIDGQSGGFIGINGPDAPASQSGTAILGGVFQHFGNASSPIWAQPMIVRENGLVDGTEFRDNFNTGLTVQGDNARVIHVYTHHNGRYGLTVSMPCVGCRGPAGVLIRDSEIAFNNTRRLPTNDDAAGTKFLATDGLIVRGNEVHDNYGAGLWWDGPNRNVQAYGNVVYNNRNWGIFYELSYGGTKIYDNTLTNNALGDGTPNWFNSVQLLVSCSDGSVGTGIEIYENTIDGVAYPLGLINHDKHPTRTRQVYVHHNHMILRAPTARVGAVAFDGLTELFDAAAGNRFDYNTYSVLDLTAAYWAWGGRALPWGRWQASGHDVNGALDLTA